MLLPDHPVWSVLTEDLVLDLLDQIPLMTLSKALVHLGLILLQHPSIALLLSKWGSFYVDKAGLFWSFAGSISSVHVTGPESAGGTTVPSCGQALVVPANTVPEGPVAPSGGVCCRNGKRVGLRGSGASGSVDQASGSGPSTGEKRRGEPVGGDAGGGGVGPNKRSRVSGDGDSGPEVSSGGNEGSEVPDGGSMPDGSGMASGKGKAPGGSGKAPDKGRNGSKKGGKGGKKGGKGSGTASEVWLTNGTPPRLNDGAKHLFD
jgi:hypothetical protein